MRSIFKNFSYTLASNLLSFFISALVTFIGPKRLGVESYSYFQLYLFYSNYTGFLHFGWADGIFLRYGGEYFENLNRQRFSGQFRLYCILECFFSLCVSLLGYYYAPNHEKSIVFVMVGISIVLLLPRTFLQYILQGTNRIKEYVKLTIIDRLVYFGIVSVVLLGNMDSFILIIAGDLLGKLCALCYAVYQCKDILFSKPEAFKDIFFETKENIRAGIKLMFANLASLLMIGIVRIAIEYQWDIVTFGKISLTLSVSNLLMLFIRTVALIMFPALRRTDSKKLPSIYQFVRISIMIPLLGMLIFYYPAKVLLSIWLPQYADSFIYMALLFPMCIFESKMSLFVETFMKTLRFEKTLMEVNGITMILSVFLTGIVVFVFKNLDMAILLIVLLLAFRCILAEVLLSKKMEISVYKDILYEVALTVCFISVSWYIGGITGTVVYFVCYLIYLVLKKEDILNFIKEVRNFKDKIKA